MLRYKYSLLFILLVATALATSLFGDVFDTTTPPDTDPTTVPFDATLSPLLTGRPQNINRMSQRQWAKLPGISKAKAKLIVDERRRNGPFQDFAALSTRVTGIGPRTVEKIKRWLVDPKENN